MKTIKNTTVALLGLAVVIALVYGNHFVNSFHFDDSHVIVDNPFIRDLGHTPEYFTDATTFSVQPLNQSYRPLLMFSFGLDYAMGNAVNPFWFHVQSFLWFLLHCFLIFALAHALIRKASPDFAYVKYVALFAAAWFGLHTAIAETVNYISARSDILSAFAVLSSLTIWASFPRLRKWQIYLIPFAGGLLVKEQTAMFVPIFVVYLWLFEENRSLGEMFMRSGLTSWKRVIWAALPVIGVGLIGTVLVLCMASDTFTPGGGSRWNYLITQPWIMTRYLIAFFIPANLSADTDWTVIRNVFDERVIVGILVVLSLIVMAFRLSKGTKGRPISFGIAWFFIALLPTSSFIPFAEVTNDHRMFFPFTGLVIAVVWLVASRLEVFMTSGGLPRWSKIALALAALAVLCGNAYGVYQRNEVWRTEETLWQDVTEKSPTNGRGLMNYGLSQMNVGKLNVALSYFQKALQYTPNYPSLHINLAICKNAMGMSSEAEKSFKTAISLGSNRYEPYFHYARFLNAAKRYDEALSNIENAVKFNPWNMRVRSLAMEIYAAQEMWDNLKTFAQDTLSRLPSDATTQNYLAMAQKRQPKSTRLEELARTSPTPENFVNMSHEYYNKRQYEKCIEASREALKLKPDYAEAYNNMCSAYNALKQYDDAIEACRKALDIQPDFQLAKNNLNYALSMKK